MANYTIRLPRLPVNWKDQPKLFERYWDEAMTRLEETLNAILAIPEIQEALADLDAATQAALDAADAAQTAADNAQNATDAQTSENSIVASFVAGYTPPLIQADSSGNVTIANHQRVYGDTTLNPTVSVTGSTFATTATTGQIVRVYYDQPSRAGGSVTYQYTVDPTTPPVQGGNRHSVAVVEIPAAGTQDGKGLQPPGYIEP